MAMPAGTTWETGTKFEGDKMSRSRNKIYLPKALAARMNEVARQVKAAKKELHLVDYEIYSIAKLLGYKYIGKGAGDGAFEKDGIVIKQMYRADKCPLFCRVPTIVVEDRGTGECGVYVQPLCDLTGRQTALSMLLSIFGDYVSAPDDLHIKNVGWFDGQPVMFDW